MTKIESKINRVDVNLTAKGANKRGPSDRSDPLWGMRDPLVGMSDPLLGKSDPLLGIPSPSVDMLSAVTSEIAGESSVHEKLSMLKT